MLAYLPLSRSLQVPKLSNWAMFFTSTWKTTTLRSLAA